jgi:triosephosphate isomerase
MLADAGATAVIVGHSERRTDHHETDEIVRAKALAARRARLLAIVCVGETRTERDAGRAMEVVGGQLAGSIPDGATAANLVVAYEPVWAIGTGLTPTSEDIEQIHTFIRQKLTGRFKEEGAGVRLLYGGSLKPGNAAEILSLIDVNGGLIGGASLKAADFLAIAAAVPT